MKMKSPDPHPEPTVVRYFQSLSAHKIDENITNVHMFTEDIFLGLMPIGGSSDKQKNFSIVFNGTQKEKERAQKIIKYIAQYDDCDPTKNVCNAVNELAKRLAWEGCAVYEIISHKSHEPSLFNFTPKNLIKLMGYFVQIIPKGDWKRCGKKYILISNNKIWRIQMPNRLGGQKGHLKTMNKLKLFNSLMPKFQQKDGDLNMLSNKFDYSMYVESCAIHSRKITKIWGWNCRDGSQNRSTELFYFYKMLSFRFAQAVLRKHIIVELNSLLSRLKIDCVIEVNGLPTPDEIMDIRNQLLSGKITFRPASDKVWI